MLTTFHDHHTSITIDGRPICNLRFADDIDLMGSSNNELQELTDRLVTSASAYSMEVSTSSTERIASGITMNGEPLEEVSKDGSCAAEIHLRIATATAAMARLGRIWKSNISFHTKYRLCRSQVVSILLYGCEAWTLMAETEKRIQALTV